MKPSPPSAPAPPPLTDAQRGALVTLLGDDDPEVFAAVRRRIVEEGPDARAWLRPLTRSGHPATRRHAQELVRHFGRQEADIRMLHFCLTHGDEMPLEDGVWRLAATRFPDLNPAGYAALLDQWAGDLRERLAGVPPGDGVVATLNEVLFQRLGFAGDEEHYYDPENSYLNRVLDRRTGNPISLCAVALLLARRLGLPFVGVGLPGHFICRYQPPQAQVYVDFFNRGRVLSRADCVRFLQQSGRDFHEEYLAPINARRMLLRMCANLERIYARHGDKEDAERCSRYLVALSR